MSYGPTASLLISRWLSSWTSAGPPTVTRPLYIQGSVPGRLHHLVDDERYPLERTCGGRATGRARCPRAQPQGRLAGPAPRRPHRVHRPVRLRQVEPRLRHDLRRGPAALRGEPVLVRPAVPRPDGQARRRLHRGPVPGGVDRPEVHLPQPAVDGRHHHRGLRLPAPAVRAHRGPALPDLRRRHRPADAAADRRPGARAAVRHPVPGAGTGGPRAQGGVRRPLPPARGPGLLAGAGRRRRRRARRRARRSRSRRSTRSRWSSTG